MKVDRRNLFLSGLSGLCMATVFGPPALSQMLPQLHLLLVRREGLSPTNQCIAPCIRGSLFDITGSPAGDSSLLLDMLMHDPICDVIERPWKENAPNVSSVPSGHYESRVRSDATKSWMTTRNRTWRIELLDVPHRSNIQFHFGQDEKWSEGCFIVGEHIQVTELTGITSDYCRLKNSEQMAGRLRALFEGPGHSGASPRVTIVNSADIFPGMNPSC